MYPEGIFERGVNPPAAPISFAAMEAPTITERLGAMKVMQLSTKDKMLVLASLN